MKLLTPRDAAERLGVQAQTLRGYVERGLLTDHRTPGNHRRYDLAEVDRYLRGGGEVVAPVRREALYLRVSGRSQASTLATQEKLLRESSSGEIVEVYTDVASGLNENRRGLARLLDAAERESFTVVRVTHPDRLSRFGYSYLERLLASHGVELESLDEHETRSPEEELTADFMTLLASFSGKLYRLRGYADQRRLLDRAGEALGD